MIKIVVNDKEAEIQSSHYVVIASGLMLLEKHLKDSIVNAFVDGNKDLHALYVNEREHINGLLTAVNTLAEEFTFEEFESAMTWVSTL